MRQFNGLKWVRGPTKGQRKNGAWLECKEDARIFAEVDAEIRHQKFLEDNPWAKNNSDYAAVSADVLVADEDYPWEKELREFKIGL